MRKKKETGKTSKDTPKKRKTKRSQLEFPGLVKGATSRIRQEYLDQDYIDRLSPQDKDWLNRFNEEWLGANFKHPGDTIHKTDAARKEIYNRNNARNRDLLGQLKAQNKLMNSEVVKEMLEKEELTQNVTPDDIENVLIEFIDKMNED